MLPKKQRLTTKGVVLLFKEQRKTIYSPHFKIITAQQHGLLNKKFAVVVSKKVASTAVERNRLRRRIYRVIQNMNVNLFPAQAIVVQCLKGVLDISLLEFNKELIEGLNKALL